MPAWFAGPTMPLLFHALHDRGGAVVADLQAALDVGGRGLAVAQHDRDRLVIGIAALVAEGALVEDGALFRCAAVAAPASSSSSDVTASRYSGRACSLRCATTFSTSWSETKGPWTRGMRPPPAM